MKYSHENVIYIIIRGGGQEEDDLINLKFDQRAVKVGAPRASKIMTKTMAKLVVGIKTGGSFRQVCAILAYSLQIYLW